MFAYDVAWSKQERILQIFVDHVDALILVILCYLSHTLHEICTKKYTKQRIQFYFLSRI
jgi:hypothetical protein